MKIGEKFCLDGIRGACIQESVDGCDGCGLYQTYKECTQCGDDSSCTSIGDDNLCSACRILNEEPCVVSDNINKEKQRVPFGSSEVAEDVHKFVDDAFGILHEIHEIDESVSSIEKNISPINDGVGKECLRITNCVSSIKSNMNEVRKDIDKIIEIIGE